MNYSTAVFLINDKVRAVAITYEDDTASKKAERTIFKTFDATIKVDDLVVIPTDTRHRMTVVKVVDVDVEVNFESGPQLAWIIDVIDRTAYDSVLAGEDAAIQTIKSAEKRKAQDALKQAIMANMPDDVKTLTISSMGAVAHVLED